MEADIANYKSYMCRNAYAIGSGASKGLEKFPDNVTRFVGNGALMRRTEE